MVRYVWSVPLIYVKQNIMETTTLKKFPYQKALIALIKKEVPLHSVYVISVYKEKQTQNVYLFPESVNSQKVITYTLLLITHKPIPKNMQDFMDTLYNNMQQRCKVYAIVYTLPKVKAKLNDGCRFLSKVLNQTPCMYQEDDALSKLGLFGLSFHKHVYQRIQEEWNSRMRRANCLISLVDVVDVIGDSTSRLAIMHHALEQICMALLYVFWEFKPQHYSLSYMLHLCSLFTQLPETVFPQKSYGLQRMYYILCNAHHIMRFKAHSEFSEKDVDKAFNRCERFFEEAKGIGEGQLEYLEGIHC
ncbi:hypothetical protein [Mariniflexile sp. HMF6888]|uniref:hypothetical protein n=1 Tax=Mariniflexile sp. HMF6888 TaxID=3373086 RepID=UPI0037B64F11